ncbi:hypothetical protein BC834DRAFT_274459 [Gloeopeniophorella convolvens]|nr:hypothetical protein BC834DRAFT_274459 [Gloeopeniophorella convolvens]
MSYSSTYIASAPPRHLRDEIGPRVFHRPSESPNAVSFTNQASNYRFIDSPTRSIGSQPRVVPGLSQHVSAALSTDCEASRVCSSLRDELIAALLAEGLALGIAAKKTYPSPHHRWSGHRGRKDTFYSPSPTDYLPIQTHTSGVHAATVVTPPKAEEQGLNGHLIQFQRLSLSSSSSRSGSSLSSDGGRPSRVAISAKATSKLYYKTPTFIQSPHPDELPPPPPIFRTQQRPGDVYRSAAPLASDLWSETKGNSLRAGVGSSEELKRPLRSNLSVDYDRMYNAPSPSAPGFPLLPLHWLEPQAAYCDVPILSPTPRYAYKTATILLPASLNK